MSQLDVPSRMRYGANHLNDAWMNREFTLFVQPKMALDQRRIVGVECLLRWAKEGRIVAPAQFLPLIRALPQREKFTEFVVLEGIAVMESLDQAGFAGSVSINMDIDELSESTIRLIIDRASQYYGNNSLEVEVTEHASLFEQPHLINRLSRLREAGINVALDDFGTGYSNYSVLDRIPFDTLKLDKSFIQSGSVLTQTIIKHVIEVADLMQKQLIIEGVETFNHIRQCQFLGANWIQGFEVGKPMPVEHFIGQYGKGANRCLNG